MCGCRIIFLGRFQDFFVNGFSAVSCDFGVLIRKDELMSFISAIFSRKLQLCFVLGFFFFLAMPCGLWDFSSLTRD